MNTATQCEKDQKEFNAKCNAAYALMIKKQSIKLATTLLTPPSNKWFNLKE